MKNFATLLVAAALLTGCNVSFNSGAGKAIELEAGTVDQQKVAAKAADVFLEQLDSGAADETWSQASPYLHQLTNQAMWSAGIRTFRSSVGIFQSRKLNDVGFTHSVKGVPTGDYAAVDFDTTFASSAVTERVWLHDDNGSWKVMGYFLSKSFKTHL
jgi:predicted small secreted protein